MACASIREWAIIELREAGKPTTRRVLGVTLRHPRLGGGYSYLGRPLSLIDLPNKRCVTVADRDIELIGAPLPTGKLPGNVRAAIARGVVDWELDFPSWRCLDVDLAAAGGKWSVDDEKRRQSVLEELSAEFARRLAALRAPDARARFDAVMAAKSRAKNRSKAGVSF
jgi:hypothetical protein